MYFNLKKKNFQNVQRQIFASNVLDKNVFKYLCRFGDVKCSNIPGTSSLNRYEWEWFQGVINFLLKLILFLIIPIITFVVWTQYISIHPLSTSNVLYIFNTILFHWGSTSTCIFILIIFSDIEHFTVHHFTMLSKVIIILNFFRYCNWRYFKSFAKFYIMNEKFFHHHHHLLSFKILFARVKGKIKKKKSPYACVSGIKFVIFFFILILINWLYKYSNFMFKVSFDKISYILTFWLVQFYQNFAII